MSTVLLVEDEDVLRELTGEMLADLSFTVVAAASAEDALRLCREQADRIDLLVTDLSLPAMNGRELAARARQVIPGLSVLLTSGYGATEAAGAAADHGMGVLQRPYRPSLLEATLRRLLAAI
jgi:CheY-like chemotaxis protein